MQVGVEVAEHVDLVEHVPVEVAHDPVQVVAAGGERLEVGGVALPLGDHDLDQRDAVDELGGQHARRGVVAMDPGDPLDLVALRVLVEQHGLARLDQVVELVRRPARELVDDLPAAGRPEDVASSPGSGWSSTSARCPPARVVRMPGRWTFTATASPLWRTARWTWPIEAAANDSWLNDRKMISGSAAELLEDDRADLVVRERLDLVQQPEELVAIGRRQQVEPQGQHLAELDPGAAQALEREAQPHRAGAPVGPRQVEGRGDEEREQDDEDAPDPTRVPEQRSHVASGRSAAARRREVLRRESSATRGPGAGLEPSGTLVIHGDALAPRRQGGLLLPFATGPDELRERPP